MNAATQLPPLPVPRPPGDTLRRGAATTTRLGQLPLLSTSRLKCPCCGTFLQCSPEQTTMEAPCPACTITLRLTTRITAAGPQSGQSNR